MDDLGVPVLRNDDSALFAIQGRSGSVGGPTLRPFLGSMCIRSLFFSKKRLCVFFKAMLQHISTYTSLMNWPKFLVDAKKASLFPLFPSHICWFWLL